MRGPDQVKRPSPWIPQIQFTDKLHQLLCRFIALHVVKLSYTESCLPPTFIQSHVDCPVVLETLQLLLHAPLAATVIQRTNQQHFQGSLALPVVIQHGFFLLAHKALAHHPVPRAAVRVLVAHVTCLDAIHPFCLSLGLRPGAWRSWSTGGQGHGQSWATIPGTRCLI